MRAEALPWQEPLPLVKAVDALGGPYVFLHSALVSERARLSILAFDLREEITGSTLDVLGNRLSHDQEAFENAWFGYLSYELGGVTHEGSSPLLWMGRFGAIVVFDHASRTLMLHSDTPCRLPNPLPIAEVQPAARILGPDRPAAAFLDGVESLRRDILDGKLYQCNLTRKWRGTIADINRVDLFARLIDASPAPYMALARTGTVDILSSSPELFLHVNAAGRATTQPIKGSAPRGQDAENDQVLRENLLASAKERAENLMITDLMRNDLSRTCGNVRVDALYEVDTYATIHHLSSRISGQRREGRSTLDVVEACFPPGSMTGAPKLAAIQHAAALEPEPRGIYSGALGWFGGDGSAHLSVVIRTLILQAVSLPIRGRVGVGANLLSPTVNAPLPTSPLQGEEFAFEFQTGSGITFDSDSDSEWRESIAKALGIARTLDIEITLFSF